MEMKYDGKKLMIIENPSIFADYCDNCYFDNGTSTCNIENIESKIGSENWNACQKSSKNIWVVKPDEEV